MKYLFLLFILAAFVKCGDETYYSDSPSPAPNPSGKVLSAEAKNILAANCSSCHSGRAFLTDYGAFKSQALPQVQRNAMPPVNKLSQADKDVLFKE